MDEKIRDEKTLIRAKQNCTINEMSSEDEDDKQRVNDLSMLKNQKPNAEQRQKIFKNDHKRVINYIDDLKNTINNPLSYDYKK